VEERYWQTSVEFLIGKFREALIGLIPTLEDVRIWWREGQSWDEWDRIAEALYESIVLDAIRETGRLPAFSLEFPRYDVTPSDYSKLSLIAVESSATPKGSIFHRLATSDSPFDSVVCTTVEWSKEQKFLTVPFKGCRFSVLLRQGRDLSEPVYDLAVEI